jgi:hypothetical protein
VRTLAAAGAATADAADAAATADFAALAQICAAWPAAARQLAVRESEGLEGRGLALAFPASASTSSPPLSGDGGGGGAGDGVIDEAFVAFVSGAPDGAYAQLMTEALLAAAESSQRPVVLFASGAVGEGGAPRRLWPPASFPRLAVLSMAAGELHVWFDKLRAALLAPVRRAVVLEADSLATRHVDRLFAVLAREPRYALPLLPVHMHMRWPDCEVVDGRGVSTIPITIAASAAPSDDGGGGGARRQQPSVTRQRACGAPFAVPLAERTTHYGHAHFVYTSAAKAFLAEVLLACSMGSGGGGGGGGGALAGIDCGSDEAALNTGLWRRGARRQLCLFDPVFNAFEAWPAASWAVPSIAAPRGESFATHTVAFLVLHGEKDPAAARALRERARLVPPNASWVAHQGAWLAGGAAELREGAGGWRGADGCEI